LVISTDLTGIFVGKYYLYTLFCRLLYSTHCLSLLFYVSQ